ncbi:MAG: NosD domain-containing protein [Promethearchaeota archaeon]
MTSCLIRLFSVTLLIGTILGASSDTFIQDPMVTSTKESDIISSAIPSQMHAPLTTRQQAASVGDVSAQERSTTSSKSVTATESYTPRAPIKVSNDAELEAVAVRGNGTAVNPYVLKGWNITTFRNFGISIMHTTAHFIIQNCWVDGGEVWEQTGIYIYSVAPGTLTIVNNICQRSHYGIHISHSRNATLLNNNCVQNYFTGIQLDNSTDVILRNNLCQNSGHGIHLRDSGKATLSGNTVTNNIGHGIYLSISGSAVLSNNICTQNYNHGIKLENSGNVILRNNTCAQNEVSGISLISSDNCSIIVNILIENSDYGIVLDSECETNQIQSNNFLNNNNGSTQAFDDGSYNAFAYNYWDEWISPDKNNDGIVDSSYMIDGGANNDDPSPLMSATHSDSDGDGMPSGWEFLMGTDPFTNDADNDPDKDNLNNLNEYLQGTDPFDADSDRDGLIDGEEVQLYKTDPTLADSNGDGLSDVSEVQLYNTNPIFADSDGDGLSDYSEVIEYATDPLDLDTDGDGLTDYAEVRVHYTDPIDSDSDGDGRSDGEEVNKYNSDPTDKDSDNDIFPDRWDEGWWGNPRKNWDNPLTRGLFLLFLLGFCGLVAWVGFITRHLPKLHQELQRRLQQLQQQKLQLQERIKHYHLLNNLPELEEEAEQITQHFITFKQLIEITRRSMTPKWMLPFLRPDLSPVENLVTSVTETYENFQQTRLKRVKEFMVHESSFLDVSTENFS